MSLPAVTRDGVGFRATLGELLCRLQFSFGCGNSLKSALFGQR